MKLFFLPVTGIAKSKVESDVRPFLGNNFTVEPGYEKVSIFFLLFLRSALVANAGACCY